MFLKLKSILTFAVLLLGFTAQAQSISVLEVGTYTRKSGDKMVCRDFRVSTNKNTDAIFFGEYSYNLKAGEVTRRSDEDPKCTLKELNKRDDSTPGQVVLTSINQEICEGKIKSAITSKATISRGEIRVRHQIDNTEPYECLWIKK